MTSGTINPTMGARQWVQLTTLGAVWGATLFLTELALPGFHPVSLAFFRVLIAGLVLVVYVWLSGRHLPRDFRVWGALALMGFLNNALPFSLIMWGQTEITGSLAGILNATTPLWTIVVAHALTRDEKLNRLKFAGIAAGIAGVAVMTGLDALENLGLNVAAQLAVVAAGVSYAFAAVYGRRFQDLSATGVAAGQLLMSAILLAPVVAIVDPFQAMAWPGPVPIAALLTMALASTAIAYVLYFALLKSSGATNVLLVTFLVPITAITLGFLFLDERLTPSQIAGMVLIGAGLAAIDGRLPRRFLSRKL